MKQNTKASQQQKPRRRKRKLKKSVRRGCLGILAALALLTVLTIYECTRPHVEAEVPEVGIPTLPPDSIDDLVAEKAIRCMMSSPGIDPTLTAISIFDLDRNCSVLSHQGQELMAPASCMKLLTAIAAYRLLGTDHQYATHLLTSGKVAGGTLHGNLILEADDDPLILSFEDFGQALRQRGITDIEGDVVYRLARRDTLRQHPTAAPWDIPYHKVPLLMKGEQRIRQEFEGMLARQGVGIHDIAVEDDGTCDTLLTVRHSLREVCAPMLIFSSNVKAEAVYYHLHHLAEAQAEPGTNGLPLMQRFLVDELGMTDFERYTINDGSGLSPENRLTSDFLVQLLTYAFRKDDLRRVLIDEALATPGNPERQGSLQGRMSSEAFRGKVFCKTGTLTTIGVSSLSGYAQGADGRWFAFSIITIDTPVYDSRNMQDGICKAMVRF